jgi:hypothetical protein
VRLFVEERNRQRLDPLAERGARDSGRVDRV